MPTQSLDSTRCSVTCMYRVLAACLPLWLAGCATQGNSGGSGPTGTERPDSGISDNSGPVLDVEGDAAVEPTCADVAITKSYLGCEFWPTVTLNPVWSVFDFATVVANTGSEAATIEIHGRQGLLASATVPAHGLVKLFLPWIAELKGADADICGKSDDLKASIFSAAGAFRLTSSRPVIVNQFNALEFRGAGGPPGKNWATCPGLQSCEEDGRHGCFSFSNDAATLLPVTALTGSYRITTMPPAATQTFFAITGTTDGTNVSIKLSAAARILAGDRLPAAGPGEEVHVPLDAGDVIEVVAADVTADLGGSLIQADYPVQVIAGSACASLPSSDQAGEVTTCDHLEETVLPAETLGQRYIVTLPTGVLGKPVPHAVRLFGNVDGTTLTYSSGAPEGAPASIDAGQVIDLGIVETNFEVRANHEFSVGMFLLSAAFADPNDIVTRGDPSQSQAVTVDQYRTEYVFLAPDDYDVNYVDIVMPMDAQVRLDGRRLTAAPSPLAGTEFGVARVRLGLGDNGAHTLSSDKPVGLQVIGYGSYTSYQYPGGLDLKPLAPPPPK